ncbi:hypothetical protein CBR_g29457 [Chara braunii]|uniref:Uncharacterized protein n=1 Tax=Chara braunii TaxID=69332 RepID=A0A388LAH7_CHABU|nr:hypothetical protein CBR_g29457 [Chara braunii]|eukprot:GBG79308.1 hypothetical protein CBR_g29457 [Chara braunii]
MPMRIPRESPTQRNPAKGIPSCDTTRVLYKVSGYLRVGKMEISLLVVTNNLSENISESPVRDLGLTISLRMVRRGEAKLSVVNLVEPSPESTGKMRVTVRYDAQRHKLDGVLHVAHRWDASVRERRWENVAVLSNKVTNCGLQRAEYTLSDPARPQLQKREGQTTTGMSGSRLLRRAQVYTALWLGGAAGMQGAGGGLSTTLAGKVSVVVGKGGGVRAPRGGMTVLTTSQTPMPAQNNRALLSGKDTARRDKALREVLLRDLGGRPANVTRAAACPGKGGEDELVALSHRESRVLQEVVDDLAEVEVVAMVTLRRQRGTCVLLTILEHAEAAREVAALLRGTAGATVERGTALGSVVRGGGGVTSTLGLRGGGGVKTGPHPLMVPGGLVSLRGDVNLYRHNSERYSSGRLAKKRSIRAASGRNATSQMRWAS